MIQDLNAYLFFPSGMVGLLIIWRAIYLRWRGEGSARLDGQVSLAYVLILVADIGNAICCMISGNTTGTLLALLWVALAIVLGKDRFDKWWKNRKRLWTWLAGKVRRIVSTMQRRLRELRPRPALRPVPSPG